MSSPCDTTGTAIVTARDQVTDGASMGAGATFDFADVATTSAASFSAVEAAEAATAAAVAATTVVADC